MIILNALKLFLKLEIPNGLLNFLWVFDKIRELVAIKTRNLDDADLI